jgi:TPR repeat protein
LAHNRPDIAERSWLFEIDEEFRAGMSSETGGLGRARPAGPPQARKPREHRTSSFVTGHESQKVPAISFEESPGSSNAEDRPDPANSGGLQLDPAGRDSRKQSWTRLSAFAQMSMPDSAGSEIGRAARKELIRRLDSLELRLRDHASAHSQPFKAIPPGLEAKPSAGQNARATTATDSPGEQQTQESGRHDPAAALAADGSEELAGTFGGEDRHDRQTGWTGDVATLEGSGAHPVETAERCSRELCRSLTPGESAVGEFPHVATLPPDGVDRGNQNALMRQIDAANTRLSGQFQAAFAAATAKMSTLRTADASAIENVGMLRGADQSQKARAALEQAPETLGQHLEFAATSFASANEKSMTELSAQREETCRSVTSAARDTKAAQSLLRSGATEQAILDAIASLRALHEETANRATLVWTSIQASLEQVVGLCARLEAASTCARADRPSGDPNDPFLPLLARLAQQGKDAAPQLNGTGSTRAGGNESARGGDPPATGDIDTSGFLLECGHGVPGSKENRKPQGRATPLEILREREDSPSRKDFISAARQAARTAQLIGQGNASELRGGKNLAWLLRHANRLFATYRRPLAIGMAISLTLVVAVALGRLVILDKMRDFLPALPRELHSATGSKSQANAEMAPGPNSVNQTAATQPLPPLSPAAPSSVNASGKVGAPQRPSTTSNARGAANLPDPLAPPENFASSDGAGERAQLTPRAISGSDAIVAAAILPQKQQPALGSARGPVAADSPPGGSVGEMLARAQAGDLAAQFELAAHYAEDSSTKGNLALAVQWYERAADQGHAVAEYRLASLYEKGRGVAKDIERAKELYQRAAEKGNIRAMHNLGVLAAEGSDGKPNYTSAALWFSKAAGYGIKDSQYNFAVLLARGLGVPRDFVRSYTWFAIVAATGEADAARKRDEVAARLTSSELAAANAAAAAFVPAIPDRAANEPTPPSPAQEAAKAHSGPNKSNVSGL